MYVQNTQNRLTIIQYKVINIQTIGVGGSYEDINVAIIGSSNLTYYQLFTFTQA